MRSDAFKTDYSDNLTLDLISRRRSIRSFTDEAVTRRQIKILLEVAKHAPSGGNMQPWRVHALGKSTIARLRAAIEKSVSKYGFSHNGDYKFYPDRGKKD